ncbi:hypothetical protein [Paenibacillus silvisoli]|uniref:hypothetical protein n=1 Tax=Paenibacillus silvisoli TaxID=3110539 RepID=UPI002806393D|nr:hypothetical protein [Paenibacillus silvisoli]
MTRKKKVTEIGEGVRPSEQVLLFKVNAPLNEAEHAILAAKVREEQERSGVKIVLVPYSVTAEVVTISGDDEDGGNGDQAVAGGQDEQ